MCSHVCHPSQIVNGFNRHYLLHPVPLPIRQLTGVVLVELRVDIGTVVICRAGIDDWGVFAKTVVPTIVACLVAGDIVVNFPSAME